MPRWLPVVALLTALSGCGGERAKFAPVSGRVTLNGQALPGAYVTFQPVTGPASTTQAPGSYGTTDAEGKFSLRAVGRDYDGAFIGKHSVSISAPEGGPAARSEETPQRPRDKVPARYNTQTTLTFDVPAGGTGAADFALTAP